MATTGDASKTTNFILDFARSLVAKSPARLIGYGSAVAIALASFVAAKMGVTVSADNLVLIGAVGAAIMGEAIRRFVYSPNTVAVLVTGQDTVPE